MEVRWFRNGIPVEDLTDSFNNLKVGSGQAWVRQDMFSLLNRLEMSSVFCYYFDCSEGFCLFRAEESKYYSFLMKQAVLKS